MLLGLVRVVGQAVSASSAAVSRVRASAATVSTERPVSATADQQEVRDVTSVEVRLLADRHLTLLFDPEHALDERIAMEQFLT